MTALGRALDLVPPGAGIVAGPGCGTPTTVLTAVGKAAPGRGWTLSSGLLAGECGFIEAVAAGDLSYRTWHPSRPVHKLIEQGVVEFMPIRFSRVPDVLARTGVDVAVVRVTPPDRHGYCSLGPSAGYTVEALRLAGVRLGEVDPALPRTCGGTAVHASVFDALVDTDSETPQYQSAAATETSTRVAEHMIGLLPEAPTIQVGIGAIPESLLTALRVAGASSIRFVGMATDSMLDMFDAGLLDSSGLQDQPTILTPELMGTDRLMRFADGNPAIQVQPSTHTHDPAVLGRFDRLVSVNSGLQVDLYGQVNSEMIGSRQISAPGGSLDFIEGASRSAGGLRILALPATAAGGTRSRIVPRLQSVVTIPRSMTDVVVTEFGVVRLECLSLQERAEALVAIADPAHQDELMAAIERQPR
jgi:4-hydroxybutyrate CoA-transferase